ncbi:flagellar basal body L-ring protein FlgH [Modicisalibacter sp. 'Wilcox']|uniref:flagellar basal body L-ring protein FlgH n=1 Tax=Modicisalibacter sp. 'Wilcox' TaxID=2679914 RepID=UPI0013D35C2B|nr:flagellar basal body L-ring protein FlgH [Modicisalibacter sp. 'Wilcox']
MNDRLPRITRHVGVGTALLLALILTGCAQMPRPSVVGEQEKIALQPPPPPVPNGAIYQPASGYQPLFEDRRPRQVGDVLTIVLDENVSASKSSSANAGRDGSATLGLNSLPHGLKKLGKYGFDVEGKNDFSGSGGASANNSFTGTITVTVTDVLYNGNLQVQGEKQIAINQGTEFIRFAGVVDPEYVSDQNSVMSTQVADARIEYVGNGYINEAQTMGWLQRFFLNISPF